MVRGCSGDRDVGGRGGRGTGRGRPRTDGLTVPSSPSPCPFRNATFPNRHEDRPHSDSRDHRVRQFPEKSPHPPQFHFEIQRRTRKEGDARAPSPEPCSRLVPGSGLPAQPAPAWTGNTHRRPESGGPTGKALPQHRVPPEDTVLGHWHIWGAGGMARTEAPPGNPPAAPSLGYFRINMNLLLKHGVDPDFAVSFPPGLLSHGCQTEAGIPNHTRDPGASRDVRKSPGACDLF